MSHTLTVTSVVRAPKGLAVTVQVVDDADPNTVLIQRSFNFDSPITRVDLISMIKSMIQADLQKIASFPNIQVGDTVSF